MKYESIKIVCMFENLEYFSSINDKTEMFESFLRRHKDFTGGKVSFKEYTFDDFITEYSFERLAMFINIEYRNKHGELYFCGTKYNTEMSLVLALKSHEKLLKITVEY